jgi:gliding motility-associated protein GldL
MSKLYGWGASVVILGALFKINHYPGADIMLIIGLGTEAVIFFFSAFEPPYVEPDWSLVYPELAGIYGNTGDEPKSLTQELDKMLEEAKIEPELLQSLGAGLRNLSDNTAKIAQFTDAGAATEGYLSNVKQAGESAGKLSDSYLKTASVLETSTENLARSAEAIDFSKIDGTAYSEQLQRISKNLSELNSVYESQLKSSSEQALASEAMKESVQAFLANLNESVQVTNSYKEQAAELATNVKALNQVYGNMLTAMNVNR